MEIQSEWNRFWCGWRMWIVEVVRAEIPCPHLIYILSLLWQSIPLVLTFIAIVAGFLMLFAYAEECRVLHLLLLLLVAGNFPH